MSIHWCFGTHGVSVSYSSCPMCFDWGCWSAGGILGLWHPSRLPLSNSGPLSNPKKKGHQTVQCFSDTFIIHYKGWKDRLSLFHPVHCVAQDKALNLSEPWFLHGKNHISDCLISVYGTVIIIGLGPSLGACLC